MSYDPSFHQVWVKIIGLPLQAWLTAEISGILQSFGHPQQILPFGKEAGHFRDVTALVDTKNPFRIPQAYTYREGDYTTKIDIVILSWKYWDESHFSPPPEFPLPPKSDTNRPHPQPQPQGQAGQAGPSNPRHRSPSSTASSAGSNPSEPTIDLSAWSPRSYQSLLSFPLNTQLIKSQRTPAVAYRPISQHKKEQERPPYLLDSHGRTEPTQHKGEQIPATKDPCLPLTPTLSQSPILTCSVVIPHPIAITVLHSLRMIITTFLSLGEAREKEMTGWIRALSISQLQIWGIRFQARALDFSPTLRHLCADAATSLSQYLFLPAAGLNKIPIPISAQSLVDLQPANISPPRPLSKSHSPSYSTQPILPPSSLITPNTADLSLSAQGAKPSNPTPCHLTGLNGHLPSVAQTLSSQLQPALNVSQAA